MQHSSGSAEHFKYQKWIEMGNFISWFEFGLKYSKSFQIM